MRLLLVEDDELFVQALTNRLAAQRYAVDVASNGEDGWNFVQATTYDLIVLDVNLPKLSGLDLCQRLRRESYQQPILLLTAKSDSDDKVAGLDAGADDYVVKPCDIEELCARIRALLRRHQGSAMPVLEWGALQLDPSRCEVTYQGNLVSLSSKEYSLLELFLRHPQQFFNSASILDHLWRFEDSPGEETVRTLVKRLRHKLKLAGAEDIVETLYGQGYRLKPLADRAAVAHSSDPREAAIAAWEQFKAPTLEQLAIVDHAVFLLQSGAIASAQQEQANQVIHKLVGSLGMFGFPQGSQLARDIEHCLQARQDQIDLPHLAGLVARLHQVLQSQPNSATTFSDASQVSRSPVLLGRSPSLFMISQDAAFVQSLQQEGTSYGVQFEQINDIDEAKLKLMQQVPAAVLLDLFSQHPSQASLNWLEELAAEYLNLPVLVFVPRDDLDDRLEIALHCRCQLIPKATSPCDILATVQDVLASNDLAQTRILAVDDDPLTLQVLQQALSGCGIQLFTLEDPHQFWQTLKTVTPDLLILDVEMPHISGIELCQVVRSDRAWNQLPIVFLTAHQDAATIQQLFRAGGDDYLAKPFTELEIVTRLGNRLSRQRRS
ncbi:MAG: response regulator [Leptolyngbyaceae cyanobacterium bins.302]|nr:response regulator [Leptolyngbyaceae cyanobacterium bins.302]